MSSKSDLLKSDLAHLIHPIHNRKLHAETAHVWVRGEGAIIVDADGKEFIDGLSGLWNVVAGHGRKELVEAAAKQMETLAYCSGYSGSSNPAAIQLAERLAGLTYPSIRRFFFTSGGGESSDTCIKTARYYWRMRGQPQKSKIIARTWGYHGTTVGAMSATGIPSYWPMFEPLAPGFVHIPSPYPYRYVPSATGSASATSDATGRASGTRITQGIAAANELEQAILREGADTVAMFFAEPVQGSGGVIVPQDDYFPRVREICDKYDVLLATDEVITGFGRTGKMWGLQHYGVQPDMIQFAKAITSGYFPLGGMGISERIAEVLDTGEMTWMHCFTYSAHPVGCAVALRNLDIIEQEDFPAQAAEKGAYLLRGLKSALESHPHVGDIRGQGLMCAVEFVRDKATKAEFPPTDQIGHKVHLAAQRRGLFTRLRGDSFLLAPPIITPPKLLDRIVEILAESVREVLGL